MSKRKFTAADRPEFHRQVAQMMGALNIGTAELSPDATIVCSRASDFNPTSNALWEDNANQSAVRDDVHCSGCDSPVAMSNHAYGRYSAFDKKPRIVCIQCLSEQLQKP